MNIATLYYDQYKDDQAPYFVKSYQLSKQLMTLKKKSCSEYGGRRGE
jgi:hypothetical protein